MDDPGGYQIPVIYPEKSPILSPLHLPSSILHFRSLQNFQWNELPRCSILLFFSFICVPEMQGRKVAVIFLSKEFKSFRRNPILLFTTSQSEQCENGDEGEGYLDIPRPTRKKSERKPYKTPMKVLIKKAKEERKARKENPCMILEPPENGLLVPDLIEVAHQVNEARESVLHGLSKLVNHVVPVKRCRFCSEVHIGHVGHDIRTCRGRESGFRNAAHVWIKGGISNVVNFPLSYHLYDRVGNPRIVHSQRFIVERIPAILELCIQAGLDVPQHPTKRRTKPIYKIDGRVVDFEKENDKQEQQIAVITAGQILDLDQEQEQEQIKVITESEFRGHDQPKEKRVEEDQSDLYELSTQTLRKWIEMLLGTEKLMEKYKVHTCGYCSEVQVGEKGHKVRLCREKGHQFRKGLHAWQEATIDDLVGPNYVWHVRDDLSSELRNEIKRYYGKAPALVELCVQAGAPPPREYKSMMRLDVVHPQRDEVDLVA